MITVKEALDLPGARLGASDLAVFQRAEAIITAAIRDQFTGTPFDFFVPIEDVSLRVVHALKRRFEKPPEDGSPRWRVELHAGMRETERGDVLAGYKMVFEPAPPSDFLAAKPSQLVPTEAKVDKGVLRTLFEELASVHGLRLDASSARLSPAPELSVIFGSYNRLPLLKKAVESVRASVGGVSYEIVCCDGGSTDGSREWLAAQQDVVLVGDRHLTGAVVAFNHCFHLARGTLAVANLNDDCVVEGRALEAAVKHLRDNPECGQVAFAFRGDDEEYHINDIYPRDRYPHVSWPTTYANFGVARRSVVDDVATIQGGFWNPVYRTYAADCELSAWVWKLGHRVDKRPDLRVLDVRNEDGLRVANTKDSGLEAKRMYARWPAEAFKKDGPEPRVSEEEVARYRLVRAGGSSKSPVAAPDALVQVVELVGWPAAVEERRLRTLAPRIRALDPVENRFPVRAEKLTEERVLHVSLCTDADPQAGLVRALKELGAGGYREVRWYADYGSDPVGRREAILKAAAEIRPTLVFMQLQAPDAVEPETVEELRKLADPRCVVATWCGDIASCNSPYDVDWQVPLGRVVDLTLHSSYSHVRALRAAGIHNAAYAQIGYNNEQYAPPPEGATKLLDVTFLGNRYTGDDDFSKSMRLHDGALRDDVVVAMRRAFGEHFGLYGRGWKGVLNQAGFRHEDVVQPLTRAHRVYQLSIMGLNVSLVNSLDAYTSDRLHRIIGCGALLLTKSFPMMSTFGLEHGVNCLVWETADEAVQLARGFLLDTERVRTMADAGAKLARENHTWDVRVHELVPYLDAVRSARKVA